MAQGKDRAAEAAEKLVRIAPGEAARHGWHGWHGLLGIGGVPLEGLHVSPDCATKIRAAVAEALRRHAWEALTEGLAAGPVPAERLARVEADLADAGNRNGDNQAPLQTVGELIGHGFTLLRALEHALAVLHDLGQDDPAEVYRAGWRAGAKAQAKEDWRVAKEAAQDDRSVLAALGGTVPLSSPEDAGGSQP